MVSCVRAGVREQQAPSGTDQGGSFPPPSMGNGSRMPTRLAVFLAAPRTWNQSLHASLLSQLQLPCILPSRTALWSFRTWGLQSHHGGGVQITFRSGCNSLLRRGRGPHMWPGPHFLLLTEGDSRGRRSEDTLFILGWWACPDSQIPLEIAW